MLALLYFLAGIIFVTYIIPLLDGLSAFILTWLKVQETKQSKIIYQIKQEVEASENATTAKKVVGFTYEEEDDE